MASDIALMGAVYPSVPAVNLPKNGGGTVRFTDVSATDAIEADVAAGKQFFKSDGTQATGTASGGGGATNFITGSFKTSATTGAAATYTLPYTGSGFPIAALIFIKGGAYNNTSSGNTTWYNSTQRYAIGEWGFHKSVQDSTPTYGTSGSQNQGVTHGIYKNSTSSATSYSRTSAMSTNVFTSSNATNAVATAVRFKGNAKTLSYFVASSSYGLLADTEYTYEILYSS